MILLILSILSFSFATEKYNVCSITINSDDEIKAFKRHLNPKDFNFVELTDVIDPIDKARKQVPTDWFEKVCEKDIRCDVLLISGHFGGDFFGDSGIKLPLEKLEEMSCSHKCQNILNSAQEVFLLGCNTLATKEADHRTPEEYIDVLVTDGIDRTQAERIAQARYGALGSAYKDRMQRVFEGIPNIYGFESVGPSGKTIKPFLDNYFKSVGDYKQHLLKLQTKGISDIIQKFNTTNQRMHNPELAEALSNTAYAECSGITKNDPAFRVKKEICKFYDENLSMENKVALTEALLSSDDALLYLPTISSFASNNPDVKFDAIRDNMKVKKLLEDAAKALKPSPAIYLDIMRLQRAMSHITAEQYRSELNKTVTSHLLKLNRSGVDLICSLIDTHTEILEMRFDLDRTEKSISESLELRDLGTCLNINYKPDSN